MKQIIITAPQQPNVTDDNIYCRRPNGEIYAVLSPSTHNELKRKKLLDEYLQQRRDSGIVLEIIK